MDEQEANEKFEEMVGGPERAFRVMRLYRNIHMHARGRETEFHESRTRKQVADARFRERAIRDGYPPEAVDFYLEYIL